MHALGDLETWASFSGDEDDEDDEGDDADEYEQIHDPQRLRVFDLGNGNAISWVRTPDGELWIDDYREGPQGVYARSLAPLLTPALYDVPVDVKWKAPWKALR